MCFDSCGGAVDYYWHPWGKQHVWRMGLYHFWESTDSQVISIEIIDRRRMLQQLMSSSLSALTVCFVLRSWLLVWTPDTDQPSDTLSYVADTSSLSKHMSERCSTQFSNQYFLMRYHLIFFNLMQQKRVFSHKYTTVKLIITCKPLNIRCRW